jgi:hypothetical protein
MTRIQLTLNINSEVFPLLERAASTFSQAINELVPPMMALLKELRLGLGIDLDELEFLASGMQIYDKQDPDTTYDTDAHLLAIADCLDWVVYNNRNGNFLWQKINNLAMIAAGDYPINARTARLSILALIEGLRQSLRIIEVEHEEDSCYLSLTQALIEVFELEAER